MSETGKAKISWKCTITFSTLICKYKKVQSSVVAQVQHLASNVSSATPGKFLMVQFAMSQVTQIGESISNMINQVNVLINMAVRNQKGQ